ncbi:hypothetical protein CAEBREN_29937 [Caenorhabditis brenneri]|uniref:Uncharacterized protein n=1 Tax=Caenorhabditis brenneri TaxID=135651 RepID=G0PDM0_CAEBE|nr:hypothetical protein CAEBREN_29937 [Caenorhabditis brenneri]
MPTDTNGVHFFTPAAEHSDEETTAASPHSDTGRPNPLDPLNIPLRDYGMSKFRELYRLGVSTWPEFWYPR